MHREKQSQALNRGGIVNVLGFVPTVFWDSKLLIFSDHRVVVGLDQDPE